MPNKPTSGRRRSPKAGVNGLDRKFPVHGYDYPLELRRYLVSVAHSYGECAFDMETAARLLGSLSLDLNMKVKVLESKISVFQRNELLGTWQKEAGKFYPWIFEDRAEDVMSLVPQCVARGFSLWRLLGGAPSQRLENAYIRRMVLRAGRRKGIRRILIGLESAYWRRPLNAWFWRHAMPPNHISWKLAPALDELRII